MGIGQPRAQPAYQDPGASASDISWLTPSNRSAVGRQYQIEAWPKNGAQTPGGRVWVPLSFAGRIDVVPTPQSREGLRTTVDLQFCEDVVNVVLDGREGKVQMPRDFLVR